MKKDEIIGNFQLIDKIEDINQLIIELESRDSICWRDKMYATSFISHWSYARLKIELKNGNFWNTRRVESKKKSYFTKKCNWCDKRKSEHKLHYLGVINPEDKTKWRICDECNFKYDVV